MHTVDVAILGAGPAGTAAALALKDSGLQVALIDKHRFPRRKACGDVIPGDTLKWLRGIIPSLDTELQNLYVKEQIYRTALFPRRGRPLALKWVNLAYNSPRESFDDFLLGLVKKYSNAEIIQDTAITRIAYDAGGLVQLGRKDGAPLLRCRMLIACDGAHSIAAKQLLPAGDQRNTDSTAITAYYRNVACAPGQNEMFMLADKRQSGYFWIFPVGDDIYNVGFGLYGVDKMNYKGMLADMIQNDALISPRFSKALQVSDCKGANLPFGGEKRTRISGDRFLLAGDAAYLVDPVFGHGIDKAVQSGIIAAQHVIRSFEQQQFMAASLAAYDEAIYKAIGKGLAGRFRLLKLMARYPWLGPAAMAVAPLFLRGEKYKVAGLQGKA